jgi:hypothetical protein
VNGAKLDARSVPPGRLLVLAGLLVFGVGCMPMTTTTGGQPARARARATAGIAGRYSINDSRTDIVVIRRIEENRYAVENPGNWIGVGIFDGKTYWGVFRYPDDTRHGSLTRAVGIHRAELQKDGSFQVHGSFNTKGEGLGEFEVVWKPLGR